LLVNEVNICFILQRILVFHLTEQQLGTNAILLKAHHIGEFWYFVTSVRIFV